MKKLSKLFALLLTASALVFAFASCANGSSDDDNNGNPNNNNSIGIGKSNNKFLADLIDNNAVAVYIGIDYSANLTCAINCYSDGTFIERVSTENITYIQGKGLYELADGSDFENGAGYIIITHFVQDESLELKEYKLPSPVTIEDGIFHFWGVIFTRYRTTENPTEPKIDTDEETKSSEVFPVIFKAAFDESTIMTFKFLEDKTFEQIVSEDSELQLLGKGTYKFTNGNFTAGTIILTCKQFLDHETKELKDVNDYPDMEFEIINGTFNTIYTIERDDGESTTTTEKTVTFIKQ
jgi:hypothetical protein